jgi:hypothetical protein
MPASEFELNPINVPAGRIMAAPAGLSHSPAGLDWQRRIVETTWHNTSYDWAGLDWQRRIVETEPIIENKLTWAAAGLCYQKPPFPLTTQLLDELAATTTKKIHYFIG